MNFKIIILLVICLTNNLVIAQNKLMWGVTGGVAIFKPRVTNVAGNEFKEKPVYSIAPTTLNLSLDINKRWNLEFGYGRMNLPNDRQFYEGNNRVYKSYGGDIEAFTNTFRIKHTIRVSKNVNIAPFAGLTHIKINGPAGGRSPYVISQGYFPEDSSGKSTFFQGNLLLGIELGTELSVKISQRLFICTNISWLYNQTRYAIQGVDYFKNGKNQGTAFIEYGGSGFFIQTGLKFHWRDLCLVKKN